MTDIIDELRKIELANDVPPKGHASLAGKAANEILLLREALEAQMDVSTRLMMAHNFTAQEIMDCTSQARLALGGI